MKRLSPALLLPLLLAGPATASSGDAWASFAKDVEAKCKAAVKAMIDKPTAIVDPFGSSTFGLAILTGKARGASVTVSYLCVYDKKTKAVEVGSELGPDKVVIKRGK